MRNLRIGHRGGADRGGVDILREEVGRDERCPVKGDGVQECRRWDFEEDLVGLTVSRVKQTVGIPLHQK
jgi:hypothetical protein